VTAAEAEKGERKLEPDETRAAAALDDEAGKDSRKRIVRNKGDRRKHCGRVSMLLRRARGGKIEAREKDSRGRAAPTGEGERKGRGMGKSYKEGAGRGAPGARAG